jgi:hypothetical protein
MLSDTQNKIEKGKFILRELKKKKKRRKNY